MLSTCAASTIGSLAADEVHVWRLDLDDAVETAVRAVLSPDELARAARFHFERDRRRFVSARAALRHILGGYLGLPPARLAFVYSHHGKPSLPAPWSELRFNLSHSHRIGLCAVTAGHEVGVDVERLRPLEDVEGLAERVFSPRERAALRSLEGGEKLRGFFTGWARKEAFIKALGEGLSHPLDRFDVPLTLGTPTRLERIDGDSVAAERWSLLPVAIDGGYSAAVVIQACNVRLVQRRWPDDVPETLR
jgi:4'-phosphopantetheinyl transferase